MKILHLIYTHGIAGAEKYLRHLLPPLKNENTESHLILVCPPGFEKKLQDYCADMRECGIPSTTLVYSKNGFFAAAKKIAAYTKANDISYLHSHLVNSDILAILVKFLYNHKLTLISTKHGYSEYVLKQITDVNNLGSLKLKAKLKPYYYVSWLTLKLIPNNFAVSYAMSVLYKKLGFTRKEMPYILHGVNVDAGEPGTAVGRLAEPQLVIIGRLEAFKGHHYLLQAMPAVIAKYPSSKLLVLGEGSELQNLQQTVQQLNIENNVQFMGFQSNPYPYIQQSDVVIIPSLFEPFGLVFIEALALQKAVVAFEVPAGNEILAHNQTALLVQRSNSEMLAGSIIKLLDDKIFRDNIAKNGFNHYQQNFTTAVMVKNTAEYYAGIVAKS